MEDVTTGLNFEERGIANALSQRILRVPLNQRSYAWSGDEVQTLLDDLYRAFNKGEQIYFLGAIVLTRGSSKQWEVADGQQRLATTSILVAAVRDYLLELGDTEGANKYQTTFLLDYDVRERDYSPKLYLNYEDHDFFLETILKAPRDRAEYVAILSPRDHPQLQGLSRKARDAIFTLSRELGSEQIRPLKREAFRKSAFSTTKEVAKVKKWGPDEIERRQRKLAELVPTVWPI